VHLHADDETARRVHGEPNGKTEAWHILYAAPDASILAGISPGFSEDELRQAFLDQDYDRVIFRYPISAGDTIYVPGGILHAFGPDTMIFEVQQTSDLGQSVMPTDLHGNRLSDEQWRVNIDATLAELKTDYLPKPNPGLDKPTHEPGNRITVGCAGPYFALERWRLSVPHADQAHPWRFLTLSNVGEPVTVAWNGGEETLGRAESLLLPAAIGDVTISPSGPAADLVACYLPDLGRDIIDPLRAAGAFRRRHSLARGSVQLRGWSICHAWLQGNHPNCWILAYTLTPMVGRGGMKDFLLYAVEVTAVFSVTDELRLKFKGKRERRCNYDSKNTSSDSAVIAIISWVFGLRFLHSVY
jgi:mannose-6-phosphate isomerase